MAKIHTKEDSTPYVAGQQYPLNLKYFVIQLPQKTKNMLHQFSSKVFKDILNGYALNAEIGWTGDPLVADAEELKDNTA